MHKTVLVDAPSVEPITLPEAKAHLNITGTSRDTYITSLITVTRRGIERYLKRALITQTWKVYYDCWHNCMKIPFPVLQTVDSVIYKDSNGNDQTWATDQYWVVNTEDPGSIVRAYNVTFPQLQDGRPDAIEIEFTCGYGDAASDVPEEIRHAQKIWLTDLFEHRGEIVVANAAHRIPDHVKNLLHDHRIYNV